MSFRVKGNDYNFDWFQVIDSWGTGFYLADQEHTDQSILRSQWGDYYLLRCCGPNEEIIRRIHCGESLEPFLTMEKLSREDAKRLLQQRRKPHDIVSGK